MTLRLTVATDDWRQHVQRTARRYPGLVPVVKGNGYGFGRAALGHIAAELGDTIAVGSVHELDHVPAGMTPVVLTPTLVPPTTVNPILTIGSVAHARALDGWPGRVLVKLASSMRRYGATPEDLGRLTAAARAAGLDVVGFSVHLPLAGSAAEHLDDVDHWVDALDPADEVWVSHLSAGSYRDLRAAWPGRRFRVRVGSALWHGEGRSTLHLGADVLDVRAVRAGEPAGYQQGAVTGDGTLVMVGAGSAHGVAALADGRSPFHFARTRLDLVEPPHMHTTMLFVPAARPAPRIGDIVDVQRPLTTTTVDEVRWR